MKLLLIGNSRAEKYARDNRIPHPCIIRCAEDALAYYPHPADTLIYFGDEDAFTVDELWARGFSLRKCLGSADSPPNQTLELPL